MADYRGYMHNDGTTYGESRIVPRHNYTIPEWNQAEKPEMHQDHLSRPVISKPSLFQCRNPNNRFDCGGNDPNDATTKGWQTDSIYEMGANCRSKLSGKIQGMGDNCSRPSGRTHDTEISPWGKSTSAIDTNGWSRTSGGAYDTNNNRWGTSSGDANDIRTGGWGRPNSMTNSMNTNAWNRPTETAIHQPPYDGSYEKHESSLEEHRTTITATDGWGRPRLAGWAKPSTYQSNITRPTSDIDAAADYLRESVRPASVTTTPWRGRFSASSPTYPIKETTVETIDSKEAARRYGNSLVPQPSMNPNAATIDSREAARKYNGSLI